ncbi:hypothetical protein [Mesorhizobium sp. M1143]|uniref:hypothetical protein n=1 Tax=Mesorhizobium sp. M1143 TaxID=2957061 RepID=UPI0033394023
MPVRYYSEEKKRNLRAVQIFSILSAAAHRRETLTYAGLAQLLGYAGAGVFAQTLDLILRWCAANELPPLTVLVVNSETGLPGAGFQTADDLHSAREEVFSFEWLDVLPPTVDELDAVVG